MPSQPNIIFGCMKKPLEYLFSALQFNRIVFLLPYSSRLILLLASLLILPQAARADLIRYSWQSTPVTTLSFHFSEPVEFHVFPLKSPDRIVIDIKGGSWPASLALKQPQSPLIQEMRYRNKNDDEMRIVLDVTKPNIPWSIIQKKGSSAESVVVLLTLDRKATHAAASDDFKNKSSQQAADKQREPAQDGGSKRKILDPALYIPIPMNPYKDTQASISTAAAEDTPNASFSNDKHIPIPILKNISALSAESEETTSHHTIPIPRLKPVAPLKVGRSRAPYKPVIVIDPGHGGKDPGAQGRSKSWEKDLTLSYGLSLKKALEKTQKYRVVMTRSSDVFIALDERVNIAHREHGDVFISLHADSHHDPVTHGLSVYTLSENASDQEAARLANTANKEDAISGLDLPIQNEDAADILIDLIQRDTQNNSIRFTELVTSELSKHINPLRNANRSAGFRVVKAPDITSVLI